jgi:hypothetical protein
MHVSALMGASANDNVEHQAMKFKLTDECKEVYGTKLFRIEALIDIPRWGVKVGDKGGWVEKEENLSQFGDAWVSDNACVLDNARVHGNTLLHGNARVYDNVRVFGNARIHGNARVCDNVRVCGDARVFGNARLHGNTWINGYTHVYGNA